MNLDAFERDIKSTQHIMRAYKEPILKLIEEVRLARAFLDADSINIDEYMKFRQTEAIDADD